MLNRVSAILALAVVLTGTALSLDLPREGKNKINLRGQLVDIYYLPGEGSGPHRKVIYAPGDGGWHGFGVTIAQQLARAGYDVFGLDTRDYLQAFVDRGGLKPSEIATDYRQIRDWATRSQAEKVVLVGWSEGAGLGVAAAADEGSRAAFHGVVAVGLAQLNILAWRWSDLGAAIMKTVPKEPTFRSDDFVAKISPLPFSLIASTKDEYVPADVTKNLFARAGEPKQLLVIAGSDHKFGGNTETFLRTLQQAIEWTIAKRP